MTAPKPKTHLASPASKMHGPGRTNESGFPGRFVYVSSIDLELYGSSI